MDRYFKMRLARHLKNAIRHYENRLDDPTDLSDYMKKTLEDARDEAKATLIQLQSVKED